MIRRKTQYMVINSIFHVLAYTLGIVFILPFIWMVSTSFKETAETFIMPPKWIPSSFRWQNYIEGWNIAPFNLYLLNTVKITLSVLIGTLLSNTLVAYSFSRLEWPGRDVLFVILLSTLMLPYQVTLIPVFVLFSKLGWVNTHLPLIVPSFFGNPFFIFLLRQFFVTIPIELDDAAKIDGCSNFKILWQILLPLSKPALASVAIFSFMGTWNDFLAPLIYLNKESLFTLSLGLTFFRTQFEVYWNQLMAVSVIVLLPCLIIFFVAQRWFIQGITLTGLKG
jgi:ABC-type glycerol-3-phosphate transport system permease component